jgi:hypothetical protein
MESSLDTPNVVPRLEESSMKAHASENNERTVSLRFPGYLAAPAIWVFLILLFMAAGLAAPVLAAGEDKHVSKFVGKNWVNGRSWQKLEYSGKLGFVCGLFDGVTLFYSVADSDKKATDKKSMSAVYNSLAIPSNMTVGEVVFGMDDFYQDPENMDLPAICAYLHLVYLSRGDDKEAVRKRLNVWRKMFIE